MYRIIKELWLKYNMNCFILLFPLFNVVFQRSFLLKDPILINIILMRFLELLLHRYVSMSEYIHECIRYVRNFVRWYSTALNEYFYSTFQFTRKSLNLKIPIVSCNLLLSGHRKSLMCDYGLHVKHERCWKLEYLYK